MQKLMELLLLATMVLSSAMGIALGENSRSFGGNIAGTYLSSTEDDAVILQLGRDGNMTVIFALQFLNLGIVGEDFSNTKGSWKRAGKRKIVASSVDIAFDAQTLIGVAAATYVIDFDRHFRSARLNCAGALYAPGVDPFAKDAEPLPGTEFACNEYSLKRLP